MRPYSSDLSPCMYEEDSNKYGLRTSEGNTRPSPDKRRCRRCLKRRARRKGREEILGGSMQTEFFKFVEKMASIDEEDKDSVEAKYRNEYLEILGKSFNHLPDGGLFYTTELFRLMIRANFKIYHGDVSPSDLLLIRAIAKITKQPIYMARYEVFGIACFICNRPLRISVESIKIIDEDGRFLPEAERHPQLACYFNQESLLDEALSILL